MLSQVTHWTQWVAVALEVVLVIRICALRLHRTYQYITLACILTVLIDLADVFFGSSGASQSEERMVISDRLFIYTRFVWVLVFPLAAFDVFEEMKTRINRIRQIAIVRLISGLIMTVVLAVIMLAFLEGDENAPVSPWLVAFSMTLWAGASTASLAFLITIRRVLRAQSIALPNNTDVWLRFYQLSLVLEVASCFLILVRSAVRPDTKATASVLVFDSFNMIYLCLAIGITAWCIWRLRRIPSEDAGVAQQRAAS